MRVEAVEITNDAAGTLLQARIDGFKLWYRFPPQTALVERSDAFLAAALLPAMWAGQDLEIDGPPVSARLLEGTERVQEIFNLWDPRFRRISVRAETVKAERALCGVGAFFSGGVDGGYTLLKHRNEIDDLIFVRGVDMQIDNVELFERVRASTEATALAFGKRLLVVETNIRKFCHPRGVPWGSWYCGSGLASMGLALGFERCLLASSQSYAELEPWGTHPVLDHLWSSECTHFECDGAEAKRSTKLAQVVKSEVLRDALRVCWQDRGYNCNRCEKCLRTRVGLRLLGVETPAFEPLRTVDELRRLKVHSTADLLFHIDNIELAERVGDTAIAKALQGIVRSFEVRQALATLDKHMTGGMVRRLRRRGKAEGQRVDAR